MDQLKQSVEAVLFACDEPVSLSKLRTLFPDAGSSAIKKALEELRSDYDGSGRAFGMEEIAGGYQLLTRSEHAETLSRLRKARTEKKLSAAAMETLAIIAYRQPIKRVDVEAVRGAQSGEIIRALMERGLVRITGRDTVPGTPLLYGTTPEFLETFGLKAIEDLPRPEEVK